MLQPYIYISSISLGTLGTHGHAVAFGMQPCDPICTVINKLKSILFLDNIPNLPVFIVFTSNIPIIIAFCLLLIAASC